MAESRKLAKAKGADTLAAGGALFAAASKTEAEQESRLMSTVGMLLTFALLLWVFRSVRVFWLTLPLAAGMLTGLAAALLFFGEVHILTIVIGTSLVGMLVDSRCTGSRLRYSAHGRKTAKRLFQTTPSGRPNLP